MGPNRVRNTAVAFALALTGAMGCSSSTDEPPRPDAATPGLSDPSTTTVRPEASANAAATPLTFDEWRELWSWVPIDEVTRASMTDVAALRALTGSAPPTDGDDAARALDELGVDLRTGEATGLPPTLGFEATTRDWGQLDEQRAVLGFGLLDADAAIRAAIGDEVLSVFQIPSRVGAVADAVTSDPDWSDQLETVELHDERYYDWGDESTGPPGPFRPLGVGGQLAVSGPIALRSVHEPTLVAAINGRAAVRSVIDAPLIAAALARLHEAGVYEVWLESSLPYRRWWLGTTEEERQECCGGLTDDEVIEIEAGLLLPYPLIVGGTAFRDGAYEHVLVLVHDDPASAGVNAERLATLLRTGTSDMTVRPWSDTYEIIDMEADGALLVARLEVLSEQRPEFAPEAMRTENLLAWFEPTEPDR